MSPKWHTVSVMISLFVSLDFVPLFIYDCNFCTLSYVSIHVSIYSCLYIIVFCICKRYSERNEYQVYILTL